MNWFKPAKPPHTVCAECQVHFEPVPESDHPEFDGYCAVHREPRIKLKQRKAVVTDWADKNWEKLEKRALKDAALIRKRFFAAMGAQSQANSQVRSYSGLSGISGIYESTNPYWRGVYERP